MHCSIQFQSQDLLAHLHSCSHNLGYSCLVDHRTDLEAGLHHNHHFDRKDLEGRCRSYCMEVYHPAGDLDHTLRDLNLRQDFHRSYLDRGHILPFLLAGLRLSCLETDGFYQDLDQKVNHRLFVEHHRRGHRKDGAGSFQNFATFLKAQ